MIDVDYSHIERRLLDYFWNDAVASWELELWKEAFDVAEEINSKPLRYDDLIAMHRPACRRGEMVDALVLGTSSARSVGSSPSACTSPPDRWYLPFEEKSDFVADMLPERWFVAAIKRPEALFVTTCA